jgi:ABC-2 type transport system ATP-binding protein
MDRGRILSMGTPAELKQSVGADTIVTVSSDGDLDRLAESLCDRVEGIDGAKVYDGSVQVAVRGTDRVLVRVIGAAEDAGYTVSDVQVAPPSLETVFIGLTGKDLRE